MKLISKENLRQEDFEYIENQEDFAVKVERFAKVFRREGREEGIELGREEGREQEREKIHQELINRAKQMKMDKLPLEKIAEYTGLPLEDIQAL